MFLAGGDPLVGSEITQSTVGWIAMKFAADIHYELYYNCSTYNLELYFLFSAN